ncbi:hypothetical protein M406DRAFT_354740, partial [Cryphonectria parasitica EP155]
MSLASSEFVSDGGTGLGSLSPVSTMTWGMRRKRRRDKKKAGSRTSLPPVLPLLFGGQRLSSGLFSVGSGRSASQRSKETMSGAGQGAVASSSSSRPGQHRRHTSNAWVDEDSIHGPPMNVSPGKRKSKASLRRGASGDGGGRGKGRRSWRRSFRESWPLKTISPTLPKLAYFSSSPKMMEQGGQAQHYHFDTVQTTTMDPH